MSKKKVYSDSLRELNEIVGRLDNNETSVDDLVVEVKNAQKLLQKCREILRRTEEELGDLSQ